MPESVKPQLATAALEAPEAPEWLHEIKFDGYRLIARIDKGTARLFTRGGLDWTSKFPELARAFVGLPLDEALIDGELVSLAPDGTTTFSALQEAISAGKTAAVSFFAFDLLYLDGWDLKEAALEDRKSRLAEIVSTQVQGVLRYSDHQEGHGPEFLRQACAVSLEGIVSKRRDRPYRPGRGSGWLKIKCRNREEFVIVGFTDPEGRREGFGALLLGYHDPAGSLRYAGRVGTGFSTAQLGDLRRRLDPIARVDPVAALPEGLSLEGIRWVEPRLVAEIAFAGWTADGIVRHASFQGLREDKSAREVVYNPSRIPAASASSAGATKPQPKALSAAVPTPVRGGTVLFAGVRLTHPDRILYPEPGYTKLDVARYYAAVERQALAQLGHRPLTLLRGPGGPGKRSFYQKHVGVGVPEAIKRLAVAGEGEPLPVIEDLAGLVALVQIGVLEIHPWGARAENLELPDRLIFDLDPDEGLPWERVTEAALGLREALRGIGLESFVKTTGGKGLHVVVPLTPKLQWDAVKAFSKWVAEQLAAQFPKLFTANPYKRERRERIYIDYLRNSRGATAVGAYSPRASVGAPVSTPVSWQEIEQGVRPEGFTVATVPKRLAALAADPWAEIGKLRQSVGARVRRHIGI